MSSGLFFLVLLSFAPFVRPIIVSATSRQLVVVLCFVVVRCFFVSSPFSPSRAVSRLTIVSSTFFVVLSSLCCLLIHTSWHPPIVTERRGLDKGRATTTRWREEAAISERNRDKEIFRIEASRYTSLLYIYPFL